MIDMFFYPIFPMVYIDDTDPKEPFLTVCEHRATIAGKTYLIPARFRFDFASIPAFARPFINKVGRHAWAALVHDWLYANQIGTRKQADDLFLEIMKNKNVPWWKRNLMYAAVRAGGWYKWRT